MTVTSPSSQMVFFLASMILLYSVAVGDPSEFDAEWYVSAWGQLLLEIPAYFFGSATITVVTTGSRLVNTLAVLGFSYAVLRPLHSAPWWLVLFAVLNPMTWWISRTTVPFGLIVGLALLTLRPLVPGSGIPTRLATMSLFLIALGSLIGYWPFVGLALLPWVVLWLRPWRLAESWEIRAGFAVPVLVLAVSLVLMTLTYQRMERIQITTMTTMALVGLLTMVPRTQRLAAVPWVAVVTAGAMQLSATHGLYEVWDRRDTRLSDGRALQAALPRDAFLVLEEPRPARFRLGVWRPGLFPGAETYRYGAAEPHDLPSWGRVVRRFVESDGRTMVLWRCHLSSR